MTAPAPAPPLRIGIRYDMRSSPQGTSQQRMHAQALEQCAYADSHGIDHVQLSEHHGSDDSYCPSPLILAAAIAARTAHMRLLIAALVLPLHDPVRVAEDVAVLDVISGGRVELACAPGYREAEYAMFAIDPAERWTRTDEGLRVLRAAWTGEPMQYRGAPLDVWPRPLQRPHPPLYVAGRTLAAARRAAALADGMLPASADPRLHQAFLAERERLGLSSGRWYTPGTTHAVIVTEDPERTWAQLAPHALHDARTYSGWAAAAGLPYADTSDAAALRAANLYQVVTVDECRALLDSLEPGRRFVLHPLLGGADPQLGWTSLELFATRVLAAQTSD
ncbi:MAG TPA: LLM class flavin-dependent oxidoreductase [Candidatus Dormibacteraeota bacterium]|nr:LLM class flavin-dependent oxidoreductase [Candidatus Dormibacteraeota bacterium]